MSGRATVEKGRTMNGTKSDDTKTFRGSSLEELVPQIKADLGPDAEIVRQREGLTGGVGGFFQRACIEVDARLGAEEQPAPAARRVGASDGDPAPAVEPAFEPDPLPQDDATTEGLTAPGIQEILRQA